MTTATRRKSLANRDVLFVNELIASDGNATAKDAWFAANGLRGIYLI
jgi:hypothetical protein